MAFITFLRHKKRVAVYRLTRPTVVGRSMDCDVYVPDVYLSRHHCRIEKRDGEWWIADLQSSNGIWIEGARCSEYLLKPGDLIEVGTVALTFNAGDPDITSNPAPFGIGVGVAELMDTICTDGIRPADYSKRQTERKRAFATRVREQIARLDEGEADEVAAPSANAVDALWRFEEWAELDIETRFAHGQVEFMDEWQAPIFNPSVEVVRFARQAAGRMAAPPAAGPSLTAHGTVAMPTTTDHYEVAAAKAPVACRPTARLQGSPAHSPALVPPPERSLLRKIIPLGGKRPVSVNADGCVFETESGWDRFKGDLWQKFSRAAEFARLNPAIAGVAAVILIVGSFLAIKNAPMGNNGPRIYVPPGSEKRAVAPRTVKTSLPMRVEKKTLASQP